MKHLIPFLFICLITSTAEAQYAGLENKEVVALKKLVSTNADVKTLYASLKKIADGALTQPPNPVDTVISEGHLATDPKKINTVRSLKDIEKINALAFLYIVENNSSYLNKLVEFLNAWATVNKPQGNPINDTKFEDLFVAYDLVKKKIPPATKVNIENWLVKMADAEISTGMNKSKTTSKNNWNSHRLKVIGFIAYMLDNDMYKKYIAEELPLQIEKNLLPDGSGFDFLERDALHYHVYTLEPLISLATVVKRADGKDFYDYVSPSGASIKKSIAFLIPFATGEKTHGEYVHSKSAFDKKRADNKEAGFEIGANFKVVNAVPVLVESAYFQPENMEVVKKVVGSNNDYPTWPSVLNAVRK